MVWEEMIKIQQTRRKNAMANPSESPLMGLKDWGLILFLSVIWGGSFFFIQVALKELPPLTLVLSRVGLASLILVAVCRFKEKQIPSSPGIWGAFFLMGALNNTIPFCLIVWGQTHIQSGMASILNATTPIFGVVLAHFLTREERLTSNRIIGVILGWTGVATLIGIEFLRGFGMEILGQVAVLAAAFSYACAAIFGRRFRDIHPLVVATGMVCSSAIMMLPLALVLEQPWHLSPGPITVAAILSLASLSTALAYIIYFKVLATSGPTNILLVTFLIPISAIALGNLFLGERLGWEAFVGMGLIFTGLAVMDGRVLTKLKR